jgi:hypothetical protein
MVLRSLVLVLLLGGCASVGHVHGDRPEPVTLDAALESVAIGLKTFVAALEGPPGSASSVHVCKIQVVLKISPDATRHGAGGVVLAPPSVATNSITASISGDQDNTSGAAMENTVTVELDGDKSRCPPAIAVSPASGHGPAAQKASLPAE